MAFVPQVVGQTLHHFVAQLVRHLQVLVSRQDRMIACERRWPVRDLYESHNNIAYVRSMPKSG